METKMSNQQEQAEQAERDYNYGLIDMSNLLGVFGARVVLEDLREFYPKLYEDLVSQIFKLEAIYNEV